MPEHPKGRVCPGVYENWYSAKIVAERQLQVQIRRLEGEDDPRKTPHAAIYQEILEANKIALPEAGVVAFQYGFDAWQEVIVAEGIEPTVETHEGGTGTRWGESVAPWDLEEAEEATPEE